MGTLILPCANYGLNLKEMTCEKFQKNTFKNYNTSIAT
jgi:hypothetical protein